eukprot:g26680.t1
MEVRVRKAVSKQAAEKSTAKRAAREAAETKRKRTIVAVSIGSVCGLALLAGILVLSYLSATSFETRLRQLASNDSASVETAKKALQAAGADAVPTLMEGIKGDSPQVRGHCLEVLKSLGEQGEPALNDLQSGIADDRREVRLACIRAIGYLGKNGRAAESTVLKLLQDDDDTIRAAAFESLESVGTPEKIVAKLIPALTGQNPEQQSEAVVWLGSFGSKSKAAVPPLLTLLSNADKKQNDLKEKICRTLGQIRDRNDAAVEKLSAILLADAEPIQLRAAAAAALGDLGGPDALKHLKAAKLQADNSEKRERAAAKKREFSKVPKYKVVVIRGGSRSEWVTHYKPSIGRGSGSISSPSGKRHRIDGRTRVHVATLSTGPSQRALNDEYGRIEQKWSTLRSSVEAAIAKAGQ